MQSEAVRPGRPAPSRQRKWSLLYIRPPCEQSWEKEGWGGVEK